MARIRTTPEQARKKWGDRLSAAGEQITNGVQNVTQAPGQAAANKKEKWAQNTLSAKDKWATRVAAVPLGEWQTAMVQVGIPRIAQGAQAKAGKYEAFAAEFFPHLERGIERINAMPDTSLEERLQKMVSMARHNAAFKRAGR